MLVFLAKVNCTIQCVIMCLMRSVLCALGNFPNKEIRWPKMGGTQPCCLDNRKWLPKKINQWILEVLLPGFHAER